ncbi:MAG: O-antigen ligase family protein [Elusimicrobia bacterium]|nr:O-antigen ligase family protein [Candidatus Obscuribacterium magneticum]
MDSYREKPFAVFLGLLVGLAALARGAHDMWAASLVYLLVLSAGIVLVFIRAWPKKSPGLYHGFKFPLLFIAVVLTLSTSQSINPAESRLASMDGLAGIALFLISIDVFRSDESLKPLVKFVSPILWVQAVACVAQIWMAPGFPEKFGTLKNANIMVAYLLFWMPVLVRSAFPSWPSFRPVNYYALSGLLSGFLSLGFSQSSSGWMCLLVGIFLLLIPSRLTGVLRRRWKAVAAAALLVMVLMGFHLWQKLSHPYVPVPGALPRESTARLSWWASGIEMFNDHVWLGVGPGNFPSAYLAYKVGTHQNTLYAHSLVVTTLAETGLLGAAAIFSFFLLWLVRVASHGKRIGPRFPFAAGLASFLLFSLINISTEYLVNLMVLWIFLGVVAAPIMGEKWKPRRVFVILIGVLGFSVVPHVVSPFMASQNIATAEGELASGDMDSALRHFSKAAELDPKASEAFRGRARALYVRYQLGRQPADLEEAIKRQREAVALNKLSGSLWYELGCYLKEGGRTAEAVEALGTACAYHRTNTVFQAELSALQQEKGSHAGHR